MTFTRDRRKDAGSLFQSAPKKQQQAKGANIIINLWFILHYIRWGVRNKIKVKYTLRYMDITRTTEIII